jgi:hypothetical protein
MSPDSAFAMRFLRKVRVAPAVITRGVRIWEIKPTVFGSVYPYAGIVMKTKKKTQVMTQTSFLEFDI